MGIAYLVATQPEKTTPTPTDKPIATPTPTPTSIPTLNVSTNPTLAPNPSELMKQEKVRDSIMNFIKTNHAETAQFITDLVWTGGSVTPQNLITVETYQYYGNGWNFTLSYPVVPSPIYTVIADYSTSTIGIPYRIIWKGTWQNEEISETSYVFAQ